jgi:predicted MFS family arabinose efflux permease
MSERPHAAAYTDAELPVKAHTSERAARGVHAASNVEMLPATAGEQPPSRPYVWYAIVLLSTVNVFNYMDRMALSVLLPSIKADLALSDGQLGLLVGFAFSLFYAICGIPIARWADHGIRRDIIALTLGVWSVMTALSGTAQNFWQLFVARVGVGAGEAGSLPPAQSIVCDYVPLKKRAGVFAVHNFGAVAGIMLGMALAGWLGERIGWRWTFVALGIPGMVLAAIVRLTLREPKRGLFDTPYETTKGPSRDTAIRFLWRCRTYRLLLSFLVVNGFVQFGLNQWWPSFYARVFALNAASVGVSLGVAIGVGSGIGVLIGGVLANQTVQRDVRLPLFICAGATLLAIPTVLGSLFVASAAASILLAALTGLFWTVQAGPIIAALYSVALPSMRATAGAVTIFFTSAIGYGLGPFCVGVLSDLLAPALGSQALRYALLAPVSFLPVMIVLLVAAARALPRDLQAIGTKIDRDDRTAPAASVAN